MNPKPDCDAAGACACAGVVEVPKASKLASNDGVGWLEGVCGGAEKSSKSATGAGAGADATGARTGVACRVIGGA